jgi:mannan endo-1,4-beta-mannosidase
MEAWPASKAQGAIPASTSVVLSNPKAASEARALYRFLNDIWGKKTLTGQQESTWHRPDGPRYELNYIQQQSDKLPALLGLDYIDPSDRSGVNARATKWYKDEGGIATICWHWGNPLVGPGYEQSKIYFDAYEALKDGTPQNVAMMRDMAEIAGHLSELQAAGVPVLWRPFHEFTGDWFWWGKCGPEVFKKLWIKMYDYFTDERGLNNLIWVAGFTKDVNPVWFPGRQYVDIVGADDYVHDHGPLVGMYKDVEKLKLDIPIALHECGPIPDPEQLRDAGANWLYFLVWHSEFIHDGKTNPPDLIKAVYNSDRYLTKDKLPDLSTY